MQKRVEGNFNCSGNLNSRQSWRVNYAKNSNDNFCTILYSIKFESRIENIRTILISIIIPIILPFSRHSSFWESTLTFSPLPSWTTFPFLFIPFLPSFPLFLLHSYSIKHAKELNRSTVLFRRNHRHECLRSFYTNILMNAAPLMRGTAYYSSHNAFPLLTPVSLRLPRLFFHFSKKIEQ